MSCLRRFVYCLSANHHTYDVSKAHSGSLQQMDSIQSPKAGSCLLLATSLDRSLVPLPIRGLYSLFWTHWVLH